MTGTILVSEAFRDYLEGLYYEKASRADLVVFMLQNNMANSEMFQKISDEYREFFIQYELAKEAVKELYLDEIATNISSWNLDFRSREVTYYG